MKRYRLRIDRVIIALLALTMLYGVISGAIEYRKDPQKFIEIAEFS